LHHAHLQGVIHRDIKPENILLHEGEAMVADFGMALAAGAAPGERLAEAGLMVGTPEYMGPEQAAGEARAILCCAPAPACASWRRAGRR
jgi:serine/threonine protein kinase